MPFDPFDVETAQDDGYSGIITDVTYAPGQFGFQATIVTRHDEPRTKADGTMSFERPLFVSIGSNDAWRATDDGKGFESLNGKKPSANSQYTKIINRVKELCPDATSLIGLHVDWAEEGGGRKFEPFTNDAGELVPAGVTKGKFMPQAVSMNGVGAAKAYEVPDLPADMLDALTEAAQTMNLSDFRVHALTKVEGVAANDDAKKALAGDEFYNALQQF